MSTCERCWSAAYVAEQSGEGHYDAYRRLLKTSKCTPEEQAGPDAARCPDCNRMTAHQHTGECMVCHRECRTFADARAVLPQEVEKA